MHCTICLPSCHKKAANTALIASAIDGLIACLTDSLLYEILGQLGSCWRFAGDIALLGLPFERLRSFRADLGDKRSSLIVLPIEKCPFTGIFVPFSGEVWVPVCVSFGDSTGWKITLPIAHFVCFILPKLLLYSHIPDQSLSRSVVIYCLTLKKHLWFAWLGQMIQIYREQNCSQGHLNQIVHQKL